MVAPPKHAVAVAVLSTIMLGVGLSAPSPSGMANAATGSAASETATPAPPAPEAPPIPPPSLATPSDLTAPVRPGDNLAMIFARHGYDAGDLQRVLDSGPHGKRLASIMPGQEFDFAADGDGNLQHLAYRPDRLKRLAFHRVGDRFEAVETTRVPDRQRTYRGGHIQADQSLFTTCKDLGLSDAFAIRLADIFKWDIDFILDVRPGDEFHVLYEEHRVDGDFIRYGDILAAEFVTRGRVHRAVRYAGANGVASYYAPDGGAMRKAFLRAPLDFTRVSSRFDPNRVHPLWKRAMPHRGIDYAAPTGTPVKAAGDGKVVTRSRTGPNGYYVVLQHGERYQTKYLHLSRIAQGLKAGQAVEQGQVIGYVGATGWATGPHLHYEFLVDGVHKNPSTVGLPKAEPIPVPVREDFHAATTPLLADLQTRKDSVQIAYQSPAS